MFLYPWKLSFKSEGEVDFLRQKKKLGECDASRPALQEC